MSERIHVSAGERGRVWVFAVDLGRAELSAFTRRNGGWPVQAALGAETLDPAHVEVFDLADLEGVGLARYLEEGHGIAPGDLDALRAPLDAQEGAVMVVTSRAFGGQEQTLSPRAPLRLLASLAEERPPVAFAPLPSEAAMGTVAPTRASAAQGGRSGWLWGVAVLAAVMAVVAVVVMS